MTWPMTWLPSGTPSGPSSTPSGLLGPLSGPPSGRSSLQNHCKTIAQLLQNQTGARWGAHLASSGTPSAPSGPLFAPVWPLSSPVGPTLYPCWAPCLALSGLPVCAHLAPCLIANHCKTIAKSLQNQTGPDGARRGGGRKDYLLLKEKMTCSIYVSCKSLSAFDVSDTG
jgi:hypothetical protein